VPLEDLMRLWEIGERLANACEAHLTRAKDRLDAADSPTT
jgi:exodeoxyribonuclease VII small subunit